MQKHKLSPFSLDFSAKTSTAIAIIPVKVYAGLYREFSALFNKRIIFQIDVNDTYLVLLINADYKSANTILLPVKTACWANVLEACSTAGSSV